MAGWRQVSAVVFAVVGATVSAGPTLSAEAVGPADQVVTAPFNAPAATSSQALVAVRVKVDPHASRRQTAQMADITDFTPAPLVVEDSSSVASAHADGSYGAHVTSSEGEVDIAASGVIDATAKRTGNGGQDPEAEASASLVVHVALTGDIPYSLDATLDAAGHAPACATVKARLDGDTTAENLKAQGPKTATDPGCGGNVPGQVEVHNTGVVHSSGDLIFTLDVTISVVDPGSIRTDALHADWDVVLKLQPPTGCALKGLVVDGAPGDGHENPLAGVRVQLWSNGNPVGTPVATDAAGGYCLKPEPGVTDPGDYMLRATLIDARHDPPLFETRYATEPEAAFQEVAVSADDFNGADKDVVFTTPGVGSSSVARNLADIANIHWQSARFIGWVIDKLGVAPATFGHLVIDTFDESGDSTRYSPDSKIAYILAPDSPYSRRDSATSDGPENDEWHEISHHVGAVLGIAPTATAPACAGRTNHAGWLNSSTCDSLAEGFAMFLPTLASLDLDQGLTDDGYGTPDYAGFGSLEDNEWVPWSTETSSNGTLQREDLAVAQLLWDLADNTPDETSTIFSIDAAKGTHFVKGKDLIALGGIPLVHLLSTTKAQTVADIYDALRADPALKSSLKAKTVDLTQDGQPDVSPLDEVFVLHDFHPVHDPNDPGYTVGDPIARTDHVADSSGGLVMRRDTPALAGSAIRFVNNSAAPQAFSLDVTYPSTSSHFPLEVPANSSLLVHLEVPPYWRQVLAPGAELPACGGPDQRLVTITLAGPGLETKSIDSCEYLHAVLTATDGAAITFGAASATPPPTAPPTASSGVPSTSPPVVATPSASPVPVPSSASPSDDTTLLLVVLLVGVVVVGGGGLILFRRRRPRPPGR